MNKNKIAPIEIALIHSDLARMPYIHIFTPTEDWDEMAELQEELVKYVAKFVAKHRSPKTKDRNCST